MEFVKYVIENPDFHIDADVVDGYGNTPLHHACDQIQTSKVQLSIDVVKFLLETYRKKGIDINAKNNIGRTAKWTAKINGQNSILKLFQEDRKKAAMSLPHSKRAKMG